MVDKTLIAKISKRLDLKNRRNIWRQMLLAHSIIYSHSSCYLSPIVSFLTSSISPLFRCTYDCVEHCRRLLHTLLQDLTQDSATLTGWRRTKRSGEGKMIALYCPGIYCLRFRSFPWSTEVFRDQPKFSVITGNFQRFFLRKKRECAQSRIELRISRIPIRSSTPRPRQPYK